MLTLDSDPVTARETERKLQEALNELFKTFFTGTPHDSQLGTVTFPICDLFFNQTQLPTPAAGKSQIHTVISDLRPQERYLTTELKLVTAHASLSIFVRTANQGAQDNQTDFENRRVAGFVKEIFESQDRYALAQKGIRHTKNVRGPVPVANVGFQVRLLIVTCQLQYRLPRTGA